MAHPPYLQFRTAAADEKQKPLALGERVIIDLHTHSTLSDGLLSPPDLIDLAVSLGINVLSITDHDNTDSYYIAYNYAHGKDIELVPGAEISALYNGADVHILAYYCDPGNKLLKEMLDYIFDARNIRAREMIKKLKEFAIHLSFEKVRQITGLADIIGRPHIARAMVEAGYCNSVKEAFENYIGDNAPAYLPKPSLGPAEVIATIKQAGGISILAHPFKNHTESIIPEFIAFGVDGVEAYYFFHDQNQIRTCEKWLEKYNLIPTGGTDYHGYPDGNRAFGTFSAPYKCLEALKDKKGNKL